MKRQAATAGVHFSGYAFSLLAAVLLAMTPALQASHFFSSPHYDSLGVGHHHRGCTRIGMHLAAGRGHALRASAEVPDRCPVCQALTLLGENACLPGHQAFSMPKAGPAAPFRRYGACLPACAASSCRSRAPPLC